MLLRKINAGLSLLCTWLLLLHAISHAAWMLSSGAVALNVNKAAWVLVGVMALHAILSIVLGVLGHKGAEKRKCKEYSKLNMQTTIQRMSGVLLIIFTALHVLGTVGVLNPPYAVHLILPPLFFTVALMHTAISGSKAFITLGIGNVKTIKIVDIVIKILCVATLVADIVGFYLYSL